MTKNTFELMSNNWWKTNSSFKALHIINAIRFNYIKKKINIKKKNIFDIGCGGGIFSEKIASHGGIVTGIDLSNNSINIAKKHAKKNNLKITYKNINIEKLLKTKINICFDIIICLEIFEHLNNKNSLIKLCNSISHRNTDIFLSSLNQNINNYIKIILFAEFISKKIEKKTHIYNQFTSLNNFKKQLIKTNLYINDIKELTFNPICNYTNIKNNVESNYIIHLKKNEKI